MNKNSIIYSFKIFLICVVFFAFVIIITYVFEELNANNNDHIGTLLSVSADIVVDAGHGGRDGGAVSSDGLFEKDLNLELSLTLRDFLSFCGYECVLTRQEDKLVCDESDPSLKGKVKMTDLKNRLEIAEGNEKAVFVSIHMNKFSDSKYSGAQIIYSKNFENSKTLAECLQERLHKIEKNTSKRSALASPNSIFLLKNAQIPAVIAECGFLSNYDEEKLLNEDDYQNELADAIYRGILDYYKISEKNKGV